VSGHLAMPPRQWLRACCNRCGRTPSHARTTSRAAAALRWRNSVAFSRTGQVGPASRRAPRRKSARDRDLPLRARPGRLPMPGATGRHGALHLRSGPMLRESQPSVALGHGRTAPIGPRLAVP
jgi:hypothetical protein